MKRKVKKIEDIPNDEFLALVIMRDILNKHKNAFSLLGKAQKKGTLKFKKP